nr:PAS domain-containing protein [Azospirillum soli]
MGGYSVSRPLLEQVLALSDAGFILCNGDGRLAFLSGTARQFPVPPEEYALSRALAGERTNGKVVRIVHADGTPHDLSLSAAPLRDPAGTTIGAVAAITDVTERRRADKYRRITERVIDQSRDSISIIGRDYRYQRVNPVFLARHGLPRERVVGAHVAEVVGTDNFATIVKPHFDRCLLGEEVQCDLPYNLPTQGLRWLEIRYLPLRDNDDGVDAVAVISRDVTERHRDEQRLRDALDAAEQANAAKSRFLAAASHDLRQPLQSMFLFAATLAAHVDSEAGREKLMLLERSLDTLKGLLDGLFDLSRVDASGTAARVESFALGPLIDDVIAAYAPIAASKGVAVSAIGFADQPVRSDPTLLGRMLRNLVENAIRFTERGRVTLACVPDGDRLRIEVQDTGIGIPPDQFEAIFEEFHQVANPERDRGQGLGLGLAIVKRLSVFLDHPVEVRSALGRGSVFSIAVPRAEAARCAPCSAEPKTHPPGTDAGPKNSGPKDIGKGRLAVLVDDDAIVLLGLRAMMQDWGYTTLIAGSIDQAVDAVHRSGRVPDIIIADYRLRDGRIGTEAVQQIRKAVGHAIAGIILTGEAGPDCRLDAARNGLGIAFKPVTPRQLLGVLERHWDMAL